MTSKKKIQAMTSRRKNKKKEEYKLTTEKENNYMWKKEKRNKDTKKYIYIYECMEVGRSKPRDLKPVVLTLGVVKAFGGNSFSNKIY